MPYEREVNLLGTRYSSFQVFFHCSSVLDDDKTPSENCPVGKYNRLEGKKAESDCVDCSAGYYCSEEGKDKLVSKDECPARYFCPTGTSDFNDHPCTPGLHYNSLNFILIS